MSRFLLTMALVWTAGAILVLLHVGAFWLAKALGLDAGATVYLLVVSEVAAGVIAGLIVSPQP